MHAMRTSIRWGRTVLGRDDRIVHSVVFVVVVGLWVGFGGVAIVHPDALSQLWADIGRLPIALRLPAGLLFLPWIAALAVWDAGVEPWLRDTLVVGLAWMSIHLCLPRARRSA